MRLLEIENSEGVRRQEVRAFFSPRTLIELSREAVASGATGAYFMVEDASVLTGYRGIALRTDIHASDGVCYLVSGEVEDLGFFTPLSLHATDALRYATVNLFPSTGRALKQSEKVRVRLDDIRREMKTCILDDPKKWRVLAEQEGRLHKEWMAAQRVEHDDMMKHGEKAAAS